jgi:signal transduction histidine kinase
VQFVASVRDDQLHFSISNTTPLSIEGLDDRVFERFYRYCEGPDQHLIKKTGSGLGLSLCR